jgi:chemotaxis methyl-accepting protein methylase
VRQAASNSPATSHAPAAVDAGALGPLLELLRARDGLDLSGYRRATLARRVQNRMMSASETTLDGYLERLRADPRETGRLLDRLTIKVSRFYRNAEAVEAVARALAAEVARAPRRLALWSAGCGRGEEPYTLAVLLAELGQPALPSAIVATDVDPGALESAAAATYGGDALGEVPAPILARHFARAIPSGAGRLRVGDGTRRRVRLERHDLACAERPPRGAPFDLVSCRNTLIYFEPPLQRRAFALLVEALAPGGLLWLGEAEWPAGPAAERFETVDRHARLFRLRGPGGAHA